MNNKLSLFIVGLFIVGLFSPAVSAAVVLTSYWDGNGGDYIEIEKGDSEQFFIGTSSTTYFVNYEIELYQGSQFIETLYEGSNTGYFFNHYFELGSSDLDVGNYKIRIRVNDGGQGYDWNDLYFEVYEEEIVEENHPPVEPYNPGPAHASEDNELNLILSWNCYDEDGDDLTYDVYFRDGDGSFELIAEDISNKYLSVNNLDYDTSYRWRVVASDGEYEITGPTWKFGTKDDIIIEENHAPTINLLNPSNGENDLDLSLTLRWNGYDEDGDDLTYDVYLGKTGTGIYEILATGIDGEYFHLSGLEYETEYSWFVTVNDGEYFVDSSTWTFETKEEIIIEENHAPVIEEIENKKVKCGRRFTLDVDAYDQDGDDLTYSDNSGLFNIDEDNGEISFRADCDDKGRHNIRITVEDEHGARDYEYFILRIYKDDCDDDDDDDDPQFHEFVETSQCIDDGNGDSYGIRKTIYSVVDLASGQEYSNEITEEVCLLSGSQQIYKNDTSGLIMLFVALLFLLITIPIAFFIFKKLS